MIVKIKQYSYLYIYIIVLIAFKSILKKIIVSKAQQKGFICHLSSIIAVTSVILVIVAISIFSVLQFFCTVLQLFQKTPYWSATMLIIFITMCNGIHLFSLHYVTASSSLNLFHFFLFISVFFVVVGKSYTLFIIFFFIHK